MTNKEGFKTLFRIVWAFFFVWPLQKKTTLLREIQEELEKRLDISND